MVYPEGVQLETGTLYPVPLSPGAHQLPLSPVGLPRDGRGWGDKLRARYLTRMDGQQPNWVR